MSTTTIDAENKELRLTVASNIIKLRTDAGLTQAELGALLNYSDKTVSKWERGESLPDVTVLKRLADHFQVPVDYLLDSHSTWKSKAELRHQTLESDYSVNAIILMVFASIVTMGFVVFVIVWILGYVQPLILVASLIPAFASALVLETIWNGGRKNMYLIGGLILALICTVYFSLFRFNPWQLFLIAIPAELLVFIAFKIKRRRSTEER